MKKTILALIFASFVNIIFSQTIESRNYIIAATKNFNSEIKNYQSLPCIDSTELSAGNLYLSKYKIEVLNELGNPDSITDIKMFGLSTHFYNNGTVIHYIGEFVLAFSFKSDKYITPQDLHTGLSLNEVFKILGIKQGKTKLKDNTISLEGCQDKKLFMKLIFNDSSQLIEIRMGADIM